MTQQHTIGTRCNSKEKTEGERINTQQRYTHNNNTQPCAKQKTHTQKQNET